MTKIEAASGRARRLAESKTPRREVIDELFLATLSRFPSVKERALVLDVFSESDRQSATEDLFWALVNSKEFIYNH